jgi:hypothetical protein
MMLPKLIMTCECNNSVAPYVMCLTPDKKLLCVARCSACGSEVQTAFPLMELLAHCPKLELTGEVLATAIDQAVTEATDDITDFTVADCQLLKEMNIDAS